MNDIRIVIVEDNPADVLLVREALNSRGVTFSFEHYSHGEDAAKAIAAMTDAPKLFLLDLNVPRVHGLELLRIVRACPAVSEVPVAILTSSQAAGDRARSEQYGADAYIIKPQGYHEFVTLVGAAIGPLLTRKARGSCGSSSLKSHPSAQTSATHWNDAVSVRGSRRRPRRSGCRISILSRPVTASSESKGLDQEIVCRGEHAALTHFRAQQSMPRGSATVQK